MKDIEGIECALEVLRPHWSEVEADFERHNARFLAMAAANPEPIGRVLHAHLIIENFLNSFLPAHYGFDIEGLRLSFFRRLAAPQGRVGRRIRSPRNPSDQQRAKQVRPRN